MLIRLKKAVQETPVEDEVALTSGSVQPEPGITALTRSSGSPQFCSEGPSEVVGAFDEDVSPYRCSSLVLSERRPLVGNRSQWRA